MCRESKVRDGCEICKMRNESNRRMSSNSRDKGARKVRKGLNTLKIVEKKSKCDYVVQRAEATSCKCIFIS